MRRRGDRVAPRGGRRGGRSSPRRRSRGSGPFERDLARRLRAVAPPAAEATARARAAVHAAHAAREPLARGRSRRRAAVGALLAGALAAVLATLALSPAGARVGDWIERTIDPPPSRPTATLPAPGRLLVSGVNGSWIVEHDLTTVPLAEFTEAGWSARGNYVLLNRGDALFARDMRGRTRWSLRRPAIGAPVWSRGDGYRVAYRSGRALRIVGGDGGGDRLLERRSAAVTPAWRPGPAHEHVLAYARSRGEVVVRDVDSAGPPAQPLVVLPPARGGVPVEGLAWVGPDRLLVLRGDLLLLDRGGRVLARLPRPEHGRFAALTSAPEAGVAAFVRRHPHAGTTVVWTVRFRGGSRAAPRLLGGRARIAFAGTGVISTLALSPDGSWLAFAWPPSDQWIFQRVRGRPRLATVGRVTRRLGHVGAPSGSAVVGWAR